jgi:hypothetical protein
VLRTAVTNDVPSRIECSYWRYPLEDRANMTSNMAAKGQQTCFFFPVLV